MPLFCSFSVQEIEVLPTLPVSAFGQLIPLLKRRYMYMYIHVTNEVRIIIIALDNQWVCHLG